MMICLIFFHTIDAQGNSTGMLLDLLERVDTDLLAGFDPSAGYKFKSTNTSGPSADVSARGASGSQPSPAHGAPPSGGTPNAAHQQLTSQQHFDPWVTASASPGHKAPPSGGAPIAAAVSAKPPPPPLFAQHQLQQRQVLPLDATEPRCEEELCTADNIMSVVNSTQQNLTASNAACGLAPSKALPAVPQPPPGVLAAAQHPAAPHASPVKAPPVGAPPGMGPAGAPPPISADAAAQLLAFARQHGVSEVFAVLNATAEMRPPVKAPPDNYIERFSDWRTLPGAPNITSLAVEQHSQFDQCDAAGTSPVPHAIDQSQWPQRAAMSALDASVFSSASPLIDAE